MKKLYFYISILAITLFSQNSSSAKTHESLKNYGILSVYYSVPDNDQQNFADVVFRFAWSRQKPNKIAVQFVNRGYADRKIRFAIKDVTAKEMILVDKAHNSRFGSEILKANSVGRIWSGAVNNIKDSFSLHVWDSNGDEFDKVPISIKDQQ